MYNTILEHPSYYRVGLYIRLSEADSDKSYESESESIINQRNLLMSFVKQMNLPLLMSILMMDLLVPILTDLVLKDYLEILKMEE